MTMNRRQPASPFGVASTAPRPAKSKFRAIALAILVAMVSPGIGNAQDVIAGTAGPDELTGTTGEDTINGRGGADLMIGLTGNDTYIVNDEADEVVEQVGEGTDAIRTFVSYALPIYVENLILEGTQLGNLYGNNLANHLIGNSNANVLDGGRGNDTLTGRAGRDVFLFGGKLDGVHNVDRLTDFNVADDQIWLVYP